MSTRRESYLAINRALVEEPLLMAEDIPDLVELIIGRIGQNVQSFKPTKCGICNEGFLVPVCYGNKRMDANTDKEKLVPTLLRKCNHCSFIYEDHHVAVR